ncbi:MAG: CPBP family intramembrane glutamic endopeptidase [Nitrospirota bacterium]
MAGPSSLPVESERERWAGLALFPILATLLYYLLPGHLQQRPAAQFIPQILAYAGLAAWAIRNTDVVARLGLAPSRFPEGMRWGLATGLVLGPINVSVILWLVPALGGDIQFLRETPHARMPTAVMLPWLIVAIAALVEVNFRGFLLGRLTALFRSAFPGRVGPVLAVAGSALAFSFDPFMVATFTHLHWIAVWDGLVWGVIRLRLGNLWATIAAHAVEVTVMYATLKVVLS